MALDPKKLFEQAKGVGGGHLDKLWLAATALILLSLLFTSFTTLDPGQVAVRINNVTGGQSAIVQPGWVFRMPLGIHSLHVLDAAPQTFSMKGDENVDELAVRKLTVRASDGSNFHFEDTTLIFQIKGDEADKHRAELKA